MVKVTLPKLTQTLRIGVKGEEKLTDKLSAVYLAEWAISTDGSGSDTDLSARNRFIGLKLKASVR